MSITIEKLFQLLKEPEGERLEFKAAKESFSSEAVGKYCCALANEGGGYLVLGVRDKPEPGEISRPITGSTAFQSDKDMRNLQALLKKSLIGCRTTISELQRPEGRVVIFHAPPRLSGNAVSYNHIHWVRMGESLAEAAPDQLARFHLERQTDFSAELCDGLTLEALEPAALARYRLQVPPIHVASLAARLRRRPPDPAAWDEALEAVEKG